MPVKKLRYAQQETGRSAAPTIPMRTKDWEFLNLTPEVVVNPMTQVGEVWASTFTGVSATPMNAAGTLMIWSGNSNYLVAAKGSTNTVTIYVNSSLVGTVTGSGGASMVCSSISETSINGTAIAVFIIIDPNPNPNTHHAYYYASDAGADGTTFTGDTHTNTTIDGITSTSGMYSGQTLSGTGIAANTRILTVDSANAITTDTATIATNAGVTITRSAIAKIIDAQFPPNQTPALTIVGDMIHIYGYAMVVASNGTLWNSDLNSITSWTATGYVSADSKPDGAVGLAQINNTIVVFGGNSIEFFENAGLSSGSPLQKIQSMTLNTGVYSDQFSASIPWSGRHIMTVDGVIYFIGTTTTQGSGEVNIYKMERAGAINKISYGSLDKLLVEAAATPSDIYFNGFGVMNGMKFIALHIVRPTENYDYFYYPSSGLWWRQNIFVLPMVGIQGKTYFGSGTLVYTSTLTTRATGTAMIRCGMDNYNTNRKKFISRVTVIGDRAGTSANSTLKMYSNDYLTTLSSHAVDLSLVQPIANRCGAGYNIAPEFSDANTQHIRIKGFDVEYEEGT